MDKYAHTVRWLSRYCHFFKRCCWNCADRASLVATVLDDKLCQNPEISTELWHGRTVMHRIL